MKKTYYFKAVLFILLIPFIGNSQTLKRTNIPFEQNNKFLLNPQTGGINSPQFVGIDMNNDNQEDLLIFDRKGDVLLPFIYDGSNYIYSPEYVDRFPPLNYFILTYDYNCDGIKDLFGYPHFPPVDGLAAYTASYDSNNKIQFERYRTWGWNCFPGITCDVLNHPGFNSIPTNNSVIKPDYPALDDIDNDGDMDMLTFDFSGSYVIYYENQSVERGYGCDSLMFEKKGDCWGRFYETGLQLGVQLSPSIDSCPGRNSFLGGGRDLRHAGGTLTTLDMDNDGDKELILGGLSYSSLNLLTNGGNQDTAWFTAQDINFPSNSVGVNLYDFVASFLYDFDKDGDEDLIAARNEDSDASENYNVAWFYENTGSAANPTFDYVQDDFMVNEMIDNGTYSAPAFFDYNGDGLLDIVLGNLGLFEVGGIAHGNLMLYEHVGDSTGPVYKLVDSDYLSVSSLNLRRLAPAFGDVDGDGDDDLMLGEEFGGLYYYENTAGVGNTASFANPVANYQSIDVVQASTPQLIDVDRDGLMDMIIGNNTGFVHYYKNTGTAGSPTFTLQPAQNNTLNAWGDVDVRPIGFTQGFSSPRLVERNGEYEMFVGHVEGAIRHYTNIENNTTGTFTFETDTFGNVLVGQMSQLAIADIDFDGKLEFAVGTGRGGLVIYSEGTIDIPISTTEPAVKHEFVSIFPNPTSNQFTVEVANPNEAYSILVYNSLGQKVFEQGDIYQAQHQISTRAWASGVYFVQVFQDGKLDTKSLIVK